MSSDAYKYIEDAIKRINSGMVSSQEGSHVAGVFGKAAQMFERIMRQRLGQILKCCQIDYNNSIRPEIKGPPHFDKLTLGMIAASFDHVGYVVPKCLNRYFRSSSDQQVLIKDMKSINKNWVRVKHGDGINPEDAVEQLKLMKRTLYLIDAFE